MIIGSLLRSALLALALGVGGAAQATVTVYTTQASFLAAVLSPGTDTFDNLTVGSFVASPLTRNAGPYGYTASSSTTGFFIGGSGTDARLSADQFTDTITFRGFGTGVGAIGGFFFGSDLFGSALTGQTLRFDVTDGNSTLQYTLNAATSASFVGFVSNNAMQSLVLSPVQSTQGNVWATANNLVLAAAVPEPSQMILLAAGLGVLTWRTWRRRQPDRLG